MTSSSDASSPGPKVLIVEDDPTVSTLLNVYLGRKGWTAFVASNPAEAVEFLKAQPITHALVDLHLEARSGLELIKAVRATWPSVRIIAMTATPDPEGQGALAAGAAKVLTKPFPSLEVVRACIEELSHGG